MELQALKSATFTAQSFNNNRQDNYNAGMIDLDASIIPGKAAAGFSIGSVVSALPETIRTQPTAKLSNSEKYDLGAIKIWAKNGIVTQIGVYSGYRGTLQTAIHVGSTVADVEDCFGCPVEEDGEDNLIVPNSHGWCFETEAWEKPQTVSNNRNARIVAIFVFKSD